MSMSREEFDDGIAAIVNTGHLDVKVWVELASDIRQHDEELGKLADTIAQAMGAFHARCVRKLL